MANLIDEPSNTSSEKRMNDSPFRPYPFALVRQLVAIVERDAPKSVALLQIVAQVKEELGENAPLIDDAQEENPGGRAKVVSEGPSMERLVAHLQAHPAQHSGQIQKALGVDSATAGRMLKLGVDSGMLTKSGQARGTAYSARER